MDPLPHMGELPEARKWSTPDPMSAVGQNFTVDVVSQVFPKL